MIHMIPLIAGYALDIAMGDPQGFPHPIRLIGKLIEKVEQKLRKKCKSSIDERKAGAALWFTVVGLSFIIPYLLLFLASKINIMFSIIIESIMCYYILATKSLKDESMKVYTALENNNINEARRFLSYIVGRDTKQLNNNSIAKAAVETVAENTSDGVIAPLIFILLGGAPLGFMYKAINTLDSMVGYKNEKYINMGRFSAIADDVANYIPSRIAAYLMITASFIIKMDYKNAYKIFKRDRYNHKSPNSAQTESVCAGALNIMLGGDNYYGGILVSKPTIGDDIRKVETEDIKRANKLMYATSLLCLLTGIALLLLWR
ncbi:MAG: adenosylcobinamide-phosphate synthase CbiB [Sedimentibacter sp.]